MFLFDAPAEMRSIENVVPVGDALCIDGASVMPFFSIPAEGCKAFLA
jgi:hypothetical protein